MMTNSTSDKEFLAKRNNDFIQKCFGIFRKHTPDMSFSTTHSVIYEIAAVRADMELEYSKLLREEIGQILNETVAMKNG